MYISQNGPKMTVRAHIAAKCGLIGLVIFYGSVLLAVTLSPSFRWTASALSDLGAVGTQLAWIFNGGLILSGLFFIVFAYGVFIDSVHWIESIGALVIALVYFLSILVGIFPYPTPLHGPLALIQFLSIPVGLWIYGIGNVFRGASRLGAVTIGFGIVALVANGWVLAVAVFEAGSGLAIPELAVTIPLDTWAIITIWRFWRT